VKSVAAKVPRKPGTLGTPAKAVRRGGRPSRSDALQLGAAILDAATELFFSIGYGATSIEAVARRAGVSKRTFYHRFEDKAALFSAVVHRTIERMRPPASVPLIEGANLQAILRHLAGLILRAALSPSALALHRLIVAESARFPHLAAVVNDQGGSAEAVRLIAGVLDGEARAGRLTLDNPVFAARQFLQMVIALPQRRAMGPGDPMTPGEQDAWTRDVVNLFVNGCRHWERAQH
jgi:AcrR family transcriptional regulator